MLSLLTSANYGIELMKPILGITIGDAAGIGPEIILKSFHRHKELFDLCRPLVIGSAAVMDLYDRKLGIGMPMRVVAGAEEAAFESGVLDVLDLGMIDVSKLKISAVDAEPGKAAVVYTQEAGRMALDGTIDAIVSAPLTRNRCGPPDTVTKGKRKSSAS